MKRLSEQEKVEVCQKYQTGKFTGSDLDKMYGVGVGVCRYVLKTKGIPIRNDHRTLGRKYTLNQEFFDIINTEEKAYVLGMLYADGYNCETNNAVRLSLQEGDKEILDKINKSIGSNKPLYFIRMSKYDETYQDQYRLLIHSQKICKRLKELGCPQAKSLILEFPIEEQVPKHLIRHFLRGYFDGDGCLNCFLRKGKGIDCRDYRIIIISTNNFCRILKSILKEEIKINSACRKHCPTNNITTNLYFGGNRQVYTFCKWLYDGANIFLQRKYNKFLEFENYLHTRKKTPTSFVLSA